MKYEILGNTVPVVEVTLNRGESMYTQSGGMAWQTQGIKMSTNARGGVMKSLGRMFTGESIFMSSYTAEAEEAKVAVRSVRRDGIETAKAEQKEGNMTEDELKQAENDIQKLTDKSVEEIDKILENKEKEVMSV